MSIGDRIREKRKEYHISQTDLANRVGVTKQNLYKYEKGIITNIPSDVIERLASALHCTPAYLMGWDESGKRELHTRSMEIPPQIMEYAVRLMQLKPEVREKLIQMIELLEEKKGEQP